MPPGRRGSSRPALLRVPDRYADPRVRRAVIQVPAAAERHQPFHERRALRVLSRPLVVLRGLDEWHVRAGHQLEGIAAIEQGLPARVDARGEVRRTVAIAVSGVIRSEEHTSELQSLTNLV